MPTHLGPPDGTSTVRRAHPARPTVASNQEHADIAAATDRELLDGIMHMLGRRMAVHAELKRSALAARHGLSACDLRVLEQLLELGPLTADALARVAGMNAGSIAAVVDRLADTTLIRRMAHPTDPRIVMLAADTDRYAALCAPREPRPATVERMHIAPRTLTQVHAFLTHYLGDLRDSTLQDSRQPADVSA